MSFKTIYVGYKIEGGVIMAATTKVGLGMLIGVGARAVGGGLGENSKPVKDGSGGYWVVKMVELVKVGGDRGKRGVHSSGGFRGMKGKDGLLADAEN